MPKIWHVERIDREPLAGFTGKDSGSLYFILISFFLNTIQRQEERARHLGRCDRSLNSQVFSKMAQKLLQQKGFRSAVFGLVASAIAAGIYVAVTPTNSDPQPMRATPSLPLEALQVTAYRSPTCGCCGSWVEHLQAQGFQVTDRITENMDAIKQAHQVPGDLVSCHTAVVNGYVVEGHVPATDIQRLLTEKPDAIGIAVPGMPIGSPGMESGDIKQPFTTFIFSENGKVEAFQEHAS